ncbi:STAS domain-containing protein [Actinomadura decatromicini]|uniref:STAS domain-containing protein n=1 Tax=Actinomadura decatromicini TaxID=2604572 RepID=A0A5D3F7X0_9ACTN|nr:STAS domain-containing protein [Actinomadura decatromicini]TYK44159.1 STAS domain-containing protein [Actinomadura decatromicini]
MAEILRARREQLAQRWADATLFRTVFADSRDQAVSATDRLVESSADLAAAGRCADPAAPGFDRVRQDLARIVTVRTASGTPAEQVHMEVAELREPVVTPARHRFGATGAHAGQHSPNGADKAVTAAELIGTHRLAMAEAARAGVAILGIPGVTMVDTVVAQPLMRTATAVRLMGGTCVISGIRPQIAQIIAALGIDLGKVRAEASPADALGWALARLGVSGTR